MGRWVALAVQLCDSLHQPLSSELRLFVCAFAEWADFFSLA